ncbi:hypothetical protein [Streptomyces sp. 147326]|uniref:hypothetical protein n=1 Tax=Streptomyces sp. 147326 TaxID=3074379 RepID=UPI003857EE4C
MSGANVEIFPSWIPQTTMIDIQWDDTKLADPRPTDKWWGDLTLLVGALHAAGDWEWEAAAQHLVLWAPSPLEPGYRRLIATLDQFIFPVTNGMTGTGKLGFGFAPAVADLALTWKAHRSG